jgi:hypothetical protein
MDFRLPNNEQANSDTEPLPAYIKNLPKKNRMLSGNLWRLPNGERQLREKNIRIPPKVYRRKNGFWHTDRGRRILKNGGGSTAAAGAKRRTGLGFMGMILMP